MSSNEQKKRPPAYTGQDLIFTQKRLLATVDDIQWLLGLSAVNWSACIRLPGQPIADPAIAILGRFVNDHPEVIKLPPSCSMEDMYRFFSLAEHVTMKEFALAFGRHVSAGHRWVRREKDGPQQIERAAMVLAWNVQHVLGRTVYDCLENGVSEAEKKKISKIWQAWKRTAETEAASRGVDDLWGSDTGWPSIPKRGGGKKAKAEKTGG